MPRLKARIPGVGRVERNPWSVAEELAVAQVHSLFTIGPAATWLCGGGWRPSWAQEGCVGSWRGWAAT